MDYGLVSEGILWKCTWKTNLKGSSPSPWLV